MSSILRLARTLNQQPQGLTEEQHFLRTILSHLDYLFASIANASSQPAADDAENVEQASILEPSRMEIEEDKQKQRPEQHQSDSNQQALSSPHPSDISSVPSIEEISNFEDSDSEKTTKRNIRKLSRIKKRQKNMIYRNTKKPVSSFVFFYKDRLQQIKRCKNDESMSIGNIAKLLSKEWRMLTTKEKRPYVRKAKRSLDAYYSEKKRIDEHFKTLDTMGKLKMMNASTSDPIDEDNDDSELADDSVHKALTSFFIYFKEHAQRISKESGQKQRGKLAKIASDQWKKLSSADKKRYEDLSLQSRQKYEEMIRLKGGKASSLQHKSKAKKVKNHSANEEQQYKPRIYRNSNKKNCLEPTNQCPNLENIMSQQEDDPYQTNKEIKGLRSKHNDLLFELIKEGVSKEQEISEERSMKDEQIEEDLNHYTIIQSNSDEQPAQKEEFCEMECEAKLIKGKKKEGKKLRGPLSAFLLYYQLNIKELMEENTNARGSELVKIASSHWSQLTDEEKYFYQQQARISREHFQMQKQAQSRRQHRIVTRTARREAKSEQ